MTVIIKRMDRSDHRARSRAFESGEDDFWTDSDEDNFWMESDTDIGEDNFWTDSDSQGMGDQWVDAAEYLRSSDGATTRGEGAREEAIDVCSRMIQQQGDQELDQIVRDVREKCQEIEIKESDLHALESRFNRLVSQYKRTNRIGGYFPTFYVNRGRELAHMFEAYTDEEPNPTSFPLDHHLVTYIGEPGVDGGGLRMEFFSEVCNQLRDLFDYIDFETDDQRMYISNVPDEEIISKINRHGGRLRDDGTLEPFSVEDLPKLYRLAGGMCQHAAISMYSTGYPLSRALLAAMVSPDTGVSELHLATIYLIEAYKTGKNEVSNVSQIAESIGEKFMDILVDRSKTVYLLDNPDKSRYVGDFINGFKISQLLSEHDVSANELFEIIGGRPFIKSEYEAWWRSESNVHFSDPAIREKFLDLHLNHDQELLDYMRRTKPEMRDMSDNEILGTYHQNTIRSIASTPVISKRLEISVQSANVDGLFPHSCNRLLDVNREWLLNTTFSGGDVSWISQADVSFMTRGYTSI